MGKTKTVSYCDSDYSNDDFVNFIPTGNGTGYNWTMSINKDSKLGDWCYFTQNLPKWYAGGLYMNYTGLLKSK